MKARFFRSDAMALRFGEITEAVVEADWFQLTYNDLRTAPDGEFVARFDGVEDVWIYEGNAYSDVVIFS